MKPLLTLSLLFCLFSFNTNAQKWLWAREGVNDTTTYPRSCLGDAWSVATDKNGNIFEEGIFEGGIFFGPYLITSPLASSNTYITKYSPSGNVLWAASSTIPSASCLASGTSVATDNSGNSFVTGYFTDTVSFGAFTLTNGSYGSYAVRNVFLVKYNPNGNVLWAKSAVMAKNTSGIYPYSVATDTTGDSYIAGWFEDSVTFGGYTLICINGFTPFLAKYDPNGNVLWAKSGTVQPYSASAYGVTTDNAGNSYITGTFFDSITFSPYTLRTKSKNGDEFVVKYNPSGNVVWADGANIGRSSSAEGQVIASDGNNIYVGGTYYDSLNMGSNTTISYGIQNLFLAEYNSAGKALWLKSSSYSDNQAVPYSLSSGPGGALYFCGTFQNKIQFGTSMTTSLSSLPSFIYKFDSLGNVLCSTEVDNWNDDNNGVVADPLADDVYFTGDVGFSSCTFGDTTLYGSEEWAFLGKWTCNCKLGTTTINNSDTVCAGNSVKLYASGGTGFAWSPASGLNFNSIPDPIATPTVTTTYTVIVTSGTCIGKDSVSVVVHPVPIVNACCDTVLQPGNSIQLSASGGASYNWEPSYGLSCSTCPDPAGSPLVNTTYTLVVTSDSGCTSAQTITVDINCGQVFVPQAFSPNGDGQNDLLYARGDCIKTLQFEVFDRWGNKVFETDSPTIGWDGICRVKP